VIDRPKGSQHPRHKSIIYPFDYGYLEGSKSGDGDGVDVWVGSLSIKKVNAIICTIDVDSLDFEMKILVGCTHEDCIRILGIHNDGPQFGILVERPSSAVNSQ
jgi:inorganic pyrophosphatase